MSPRLLSLALPLFAFAGCSYYDSSLLAARGTNSTDAGQDVSHETGGDVADDGNGVADSSDARDDSQEAQTCGHARPPDPPSVTNAGGDIEFSVAVNSVDFGDVTGNPEQIGYDLDFRCTCQGQGDGCKRESWATADSCDGPDGRDNLTGSFISSIALLFDDFDSEAWTEAVRRGEWGLVLRVRNYNGQPDDDQVTLEWLVTDQYYEDKPDDSYVPAWDGTDTWPIRATSLEDQDGGVYDINKPKFLDEYAYVSDGVMVGSLTETTFQLSADYAVDLHGAFITANVVQQGGDWVLENGLLASRWKLNTILAQISRITLLGMPVCTNHPAYPSIKSQICAYADIYSGVGAPPRHAMPSRWVCVSKQRQPDWGGSSRTSPRRPSALPTSIRARTSAATEGLIRTDPTSTKPRYRLQRNQGKTDRADIEAQPNAYPNCFIAYRCSPEPSREGQIPTSTPITTPSRTGCQPHRFAPKPCSGRPKRGSFGFATVLPSFGTSIDRPGGPLPTARRAVRSGTNTRSGVSAGSPGGTPPHRRRASLLRPGSRCGHRSCRTLLPAS